MFRLPEVLLPFRRSSLCEMNVYTKTTGWGTAITLALLTAVLILDVWLMSLMPNLQYGLKYVVLQLAMVALLLKVLQLIFGRRSRSSVD